MNECIITVKPDNRFSYNDKIIPIKEITVDSYKIIDGKEIKGEPVLMMEYYYLYWDYVEVPNSPGSYKIGIVRSHWTIEKKLMTILLRNTN